MRLHDSIEAVPGYLLVCNPSANRAFNADLAALAACELQLSLKTISSCRPSCIGKAPAVFFDSDELTADQMNIIASHSSYLLLMRLDGESFIPYEIEDRSYFGDDLITTLRYRGKTNEILTKMLVNLTISQVQRPYERLDILDPMAGRGTTLFASWIAGHNAYGVERESQSFEAMSAYVKTYLRTKKIKHKALLSPVRREGRAIGKRLQVTAHPVQGTVEMDAFLATATDSASLFGKKRFDAIITDAPYGVVHGSTTDSASNRKRSPKDLICAALPIWADQLKKGGAIGMAWNRHTLSRPDMVAMMSDAGLSVCCGELWEGFEHRVDASIRRDLIVAVKKKN